MIHEALRRSVQSAIVARIWGRATAVTISSRPARKTPTPSTPRSRYESRRRMSASVRARAVHRARYVSRRPSRVPRAASSSDGRATPRAARRPRAAAGRRRLLFPRPARRRSGRPEVLDDTQPEAPHAGPHGPGAGTVRRTSAALGVLAVLVLVLAGTAAVAIRARRRRPTRAPERRHRLRPLVRQRLGHGHDRRRDDHDPRRRLLRPGLSRV